MEEYLQQITRLMNLNGEAVEGMMVVNKDGIVEYYKPGNPFGKLPEEFGAQCGGEPPALRLYGAVRGEQHRDEHPAYGTDHGGGEAGPDP